jgi:hypothetical protein
VLFQGGEHGKLAARLATQVIKAYVDKKNHKPIEHLAPPPENEEKSTPGAEPGTTGRNRVKQPPLELTGMWSEPGSSHMESARFDVQTGEQRGFTRAIAAPGMEQFAKKSEPPQPAQPKKRSSWKEVPGVVAALPEPMWRRGELR